MEELKTLNDLTLCCVEEDREDGGCGFAKEVLKQEAIKWVKDLEKNEGKDEKFAIFDALAYHDNENVRDWIKHFFNITEEDLK